MEAVDLYTTPGSYDVDKGFLYKRAKKTARSENAKYQ